MLRKIDSKLRLSKNTLCFSIKKTVVMTEAT